MIVSRLSGFKWHTFPVDADEVIWLRHSVRSDYQMTLHNLNLREGVTNENNIRVYDNNTENQFKLLTIVNVFTNNRFIRLERYWKIFWWDSNNIFFIFEYSMKLHFDVWYADKNTWQIEVSLKIDSFFSNISQDGQLTIWSYMYK